MTEYLAEHGLNNRGLLISRTGNPEGGSSGRGRGLHDFSGPVPSVFRSPLPGRGVFTKGDFQKHPAGFLHLSDPNGVTCPPLDQ